MEKNSITNTICGFPKEGEFLPDIGSDPNFIFVNDASFESLRLIDIDGNIVNVNSWIECAHYVKGGWSTNQESLITSEYTLFLVLSLSIVFYLGIRVFKKSFEMITATKNDKKLSNYFKAVLLSLLAFVPWVWNSTKDTLPLIEVNPASVGYYQTNVCDISFIKLLFSSFFNSSFVLTTTNVENISCVGKIMGMDNINGKIAVYIGTNQVIDILFQSIFWIGLICFIKKDHLNLKSNYLPILVVPLIFCLQLVGEQRYYLLIHKGYNNTLNLENYYLLNYVLAILIITLLIKEFVIPRANNLINYLPFVFLIVGTFNLVNTNIYLIIGSFLEL